MSAKHAETIVASGTEVFIPLNKLKKSPKNARKTPYSEAAIEAYAASIAAKGILQNLDVESGVLKPEKQQIILQNRDEVTQARAMSRKMSIEALARTSASRSST